MDKESNQLKHIAATAFYTMLLIGGGAIALWIVLDMTSRDKFQIQDRYDIFLKISFLPILYVFLYSIFMLKKKFWIAVLGFLTCAVWVVWAALPRL